MDLALEEVGFSYGAGKRVFQILRISGPMARAWEARGSVRRFQDGVKGIMERLKVGKLKLLRYLPWNFFLWNLSSAIPGQMSKLAVPRAK